MIVAIYAVLLTLVYYVVAILGYVLCVFIRSSSERATYSLLSLMYRMVHHLCTLPVKRDTVI